MAYTFAPRGLQLTSSFSNATPSGQIDNYLIPSGYPTNIASGDLVAINPATGTICSANDVLGGLNMVALGVFSGCTFGVGYGQSQVFPASTAMTPIPETGTPYWPGGTRTRDGMPAIAQVIVDPNMVFNIQASGGAADVANVRALVPAPVAAPSGVANAAIDSFVPFNTYGVRFSVIARGTAVGSTFQGLSTMSAIAPVAGNAYTGVNIYMLRYSPNKEFNTGEWVVTNGVVRPTDPYPIIEVKLNKSVFQLQALRDTNEDIAKEVAEIKKALNLMMKDQLKKEGK